MILTRTLCVTRFTSDKTSPTTNPKTLTMMPLTLMRECYSVSRSLIDENNGNVGRSWIVFHHGIAPKVTSAAEIQLPFKKRSFSSSSLYLSYVVFIIQLVFNLCCFHHPASTLQRTFPESSFHLAKQLLK